MILFSERNGYRQEKAKTYDFSIDSYNLILETIERYQLNLAWKFPEYCPDNPSIICNIDLSKLYRDLNFEIPSLLIDGVINKPKHKNNIFDDDEDDKFDQYALLDFVEYVYINIKDYRVISHHSFFSHDHYEFMNSQHCCSKFVTEINECFKKTGLLYVLSDEGFVERIVDNESVISEVVNQNNQIKEKGLKDLISESLALYKKPSPQNLRDATEKLWDAFERLKSYYASLDKKRSAEKIVKDASNSSDDIHDLLTKEFFELTNIGNSFRIRHHETNKKEIYDPNHFEYLFNRCLAVILLAAKYLK